MAKFKGIILLLIIMVCAAQGCVKSDKSDDGIENYVKVGSKIPEFTVLSADGETIFNSLQFNGKSGLLVFFVTTCGDCAVAMPVIQKVWEGLRSNPDFIMAAISRDETAETVIGHWDDEKFSMPAYLDPGREVFAMFANSTVPRIYLINPEGKVTWMAIEKLDITAQEIIRKTGVSGGN